MTTDTQPQRTIRHPSGSGNILHCYASGNGSLSFAWATFEGIADGTEVLEDHVLSFLELPRNRKSFAKWMLTKINSQWSLFAVHYRLNDDENPKAEGSLRRVYSSSELKYRGEKRYDDFRYTKIDFNLFPDEFNYSNTKVEWFFKRDSNWRELVNADSVLFWLTHEDQITTADTIYIVNEEYKMLPSDVEIEEGDEVIKDGGWENVPQILVGGLTHLTGKFRRRNLDHVTKKYENCGN